MEGPVLIKTDKNGTEYWYDERCPKCGGKGNIPYYYFVDNGTCFKCGGTGKFGHTYVKRTPEYEKKLEERRIAREKKKAPEKNAKILKDNGFNEEGLMWIVLGDTFKIKEELKEAGAKFNNMFLWHFDHEDNGYECIKISIEDVAEKNFVGIWQFNDYICVYEYIKKLFKENAPKTSSEHVGNIGDKYEDTVTLVKIHTYETHFSYYGELNYIYKFVDKNGNTIIWKTSCKDLEEGKAYQIKGKIKEHSEYNGDKQTVLTRCKIQ